MISPFREDFISRNFACAKFRENKTLANICESTVYSKTCLNSSLKKKTKIGFKDRLSLDAGQNIAGCEHSAILLTFIKLLFIIQSLGLFIFMWPLKTCFIRIIGTH